MQFDVMVVGGESISDVVLGDITTTEDGCFDSCRAPAFQPPA